MSLDASRWKALISALRPRQWIKNLLVVAVPLASGQLLERSTVLSTLLAFVAFCAASSAVYLTNDVLDKESDRRHPVKRNRAIAAGLLPAPAAVGGAVLLALVALGLPVLVGSPQLSLLLVGYLCLQAIYVLWAKHQPVLDLASVAAGFVLRAVAGGVASGIPISTWFLTVTAASAMFVVAGKRYSELVTHGHDSGTRHGLKEYSEGYFIPLCENFGLPETIVFVIAKFFTDAGDCVNNFVVRQAVSSH